MSNFEQVTTGAAAIAVEVAPAKAWQLDFIRIHLSAVGAAGNLTVTIDDGTAAAYDTLILTQDMTAVTDLFWAPERPIKLQATDAVDIAWANASTRTYGLTVGWS